jgi:hypothetical protein
LWHKLFIKSTATIKVWDGCYKLTSINTSLADLFIYAFCLNQMAAVAALCVQYEADFRPNMTIVVKALQPLLNARPAPDH